MMYCKFWVIATVVLSVIFVAIGFPVFLRAQGPGMAVLYTAIGLAVIWSVYLVRAYVFGRSGSTRTRPDGDVSG